MSSFVQSYGYWALLLLAIVESACLPIPSEVTFGFAGALCTVAVTGHAQFSMWAVIVVGTVGSVIGSVIAYEVGRTAGRTIVDRWGRFMLLTAIGAAAWVSLLAALGYAAGANWERVSKNFHMAQTPTIIIIVLVMALGFWHRIKTVRRHNSSN